MSDNAYTCLLIAAKTDPNFLGRQPDETVQSFLSRLVRSLSLVEEPVWATLPEPAQRWYDSTIDENNELKAELPVPEGFPSDAKPARRRLTPTTPVTVFEAVLAAAKAANPKLAAKNAQESDNDYLSRLLRELPEQIPSAIAGWVAAADAAQTEEQPLPLPDGYTPTQTPVQAEAAKPDVAQVTLSEPHVAAPEPHPGNGQTDARYVDENGKPLTGIRLFNARLANGEATRRKRQSKKGIDEQPARGGRLGRTPRGDTITAQIREQVARNPSISIDELKRILTASGLKPSNATITTTRASFLAAIRSLRALGCFKPYQPPVTES